MAVSEKRKHRRLPLRLELLCRKANATGAKFCKGRTVNISASGLYFETAACTFKSDNLLAIRLSIPPTAGLLESGGELSAFAKVLRTHRIRDITSGTKPSSAGFVVAAQFCHRPKLRT